LRASHPTVPRPGAAEGGGAGFGASNETGDTQNWLRTSFTPPPTDEPGIVLGRTDGGPIGLTPNEARRSFTSDMHVSRAGVTGPRSAKALSASMTAA
jgi:hypothetical protein